MTEALERLPEDIFSAAKRLLIELCTVSSASGDGDGLHRLAARLGDELGRRGLTAEIVEEEDAQGVPQPLLIARGPGVGDHHLLVVGHMDTVLPATDPRLEGDHLIATGALDMKGGLVMLLAALDLLARRGRRPPDDLLVVAVPDEEVEGAISERAVRRWSAHARAVLVIEPGDSREDGETLVAGRRGLVEWHLDVTGRAAHSGLAYWQGRSALAAAADWCARAQKLSRPGGGRTVNVGRLIGGTGDFVDALAANHGLLGTSRQRNVVPDRAVAEGEVRFLSPVDGGDVLAELEALSAAVAAEHEVSVRFTRGASVPPVDPHGPGSDLVLRTVELAARRGFRLEVEDDRGGISFPNYLADPSRIPVVDGLGPVGNGMHTHDEYLDLHSLGRRTVLLADLLATL
ncbi:MAG: M20/M25/M40 family metallo-hydrolase [Acidobacteriota bacterium]